MLVPYEEHLYHKAVFYHRIVNRYATCYVKFVEVEDSCNF